MPDQELLPIKVVLPHEDFLVRDEPGGLPDASCGEVTAQVRAAFARNLTISPPRTAISFVQPRVPAVAKVRLKRDALAKSHRPDCILSPQTCPIIGVGTFRELFIRVTPSGLASLRTRIRTDSSREAQANISTLEAFSTVGIEDSLGVRAQAIDLIKRRVDEDGVLKVQLFDHHDPRINQAVFHDFRRWLGNIRGRNQKFHSVCALHHGPRGSGNGRPAPQNIRPPWDTQCQRTASIRVPQQRSIPVPALSRPPSILRSQATTTQGWA